MYQHSQNIVLTISTSCILCNSLYFTCLYLVWEIGKIPLTAFTAALSANLMIGNYKPLISPSSSSSSYTRDSQRMFTLKNDPQCGLTAGGRTDCTWDCDVISDSINIYRDPTCLFDCVNYPICVQQLFEDYKDEGRVGRNEKKGNLYNGNINRDMRFFLKF